jgi:hypothetical protein
MSTVTLNGNTYSDDGTQARDMTNGGHRDWLLLMLSDAVADLATKQAAAEGSVDAAALSEINAAQSEDNAADSATLASQWAATTGAQVAATDYSAKEYAIGTTVAAGSAKEWATQTGSAVDTVDFSAKEYAQGSTATGGSAKEWAQQTGAAVDGTDYSSKEHAVGTAVPTGSAKDWATKTGGEVAGGEYSAKQYALNAATSAAAAAGGASTVTSTSTTSLAIGVGSKSLTVQTGKSYAVGMSISISRTSDPSGAAMYGIVTSYDSGTGALVATVDEVRGSGTYTDWTVTISGPAGADGSTTHYGNGVPSSGLGNNDDIYFDKITASWYAKVAGSWVFLVTTMGPEGPVGGGSWALKVANYTAVNGDKLLVSTSGGAVTITLPSSPAFQHQIFIADAGGTFSTNNLTIVPASGDSIMDTAADEPMTIATDNVSFGLVHNGTTWRIFNTQTTLVGEANVTFGPLESSQISDFNTAVDARITAVGGLRPWATKVADYTALNGDRITADCTSGAIIVTLPAAPSAGDTVEVMKVGTGGSLTVARNGKLIRGAADDGVINADQWGKVQFVFVNDTIGWGY